MAAGSNATAAAGGRLLAGRLGRPLA